MPPTTPPVVPPPVMPPPVVPPPPGREPATAPPVVPPPPQPQPHRYRYFSVPAPAPYPAWPLPPFAVPLPAPYAPWPTEVAPPFAASYPGPPAPQPVHPPQPPQPAAAPIHICFVESPRWWQGPPSSRGRGRGGRHGRGSGKFIKVNPPILIILIINKYYKLTIGIPYACFIVEVDHIHPMFQYVTIRSSCNDL
ncbi:formin-like protein 3 [Plutella xylostella]|uniref:formin-like protein 3 n=1 Tax=Plutella xylostella TaxID=51655 RepID=UPI0020322203|nr:formin-like protein 3 [Plutella xylostella]